jgi:hypothetical protein
MKQMILAGALVVALAAAPAGAQTRLNVVVGVGVPAPFVAGVVVLGRPPWYYSRRPYFHREPRFVERVYVTRHHHRHPYRYRHYDYDDE